MISLTQKLQQLDRPVAVFLIGVPGSGKTTWIKSNISRFHNPVVLSTDDLIEQFAAAMCSTYSEVFKTINFRDFEQTMFQQLADGVEHGCDLIIDRTNVSKKSRAKVMARIPANYARYGVVFKVERDELNRRLVEREKLGKIISAYVIDDMLNRFEEPSKEEFSEIFYV